ncbi:ABC transporter permease [Pseudoalteromonas sp. PPB1]|uniref:ABC transporter permease n=1 Tax=Pseudoalteromonas sp. PPB1 TaxID=2756136 RepID=UPI0018917CFE|nr:ABC transporter permease [Pseudoalteromonas sp. PPB1]
MPSWKEFKYAIRMLFKKPKFTLLTIMVMASGLAISVYIFSFLHTMASKPLAFENGHEIVVFDRALNGVWNQGGDLDIQDSRDIRENLQGFKEFVIYQQTIGNVTGRDGARQFNVIKTESNMFNFTRVEPLLGRGFLESDDKLGSEPVAVIGYDMWMSYFGGNENVIDQMFTVNNQSTRIVGVMPKGYYFPSTAEIWLPLKPDFSSPRGSSTGYMLARILPNSDKEKSQAALSLIMKRNAELYPYTNAGVGAYFTSLPLAALGQDANSFLIALYIAGTGLLILAAINVSNLLFVRALERTKETAIRVALGAPKARLVMQMMWDSIIICSVGGGLGLLAVAIGLRQTEAVTATFSDDKPLFWWKMGIDAYTLVVFFMFVLFTVVVTGLLPALKSTGGDFNSVLRDGTRGALSRKSSRLAKIITISQIFLSSTLLIAAGVMVIGTWFATNADYGADVDEFYTARIRLPDESYNSGEKKTAFVHQLQERLENQNGMGKVAVMSEIPGIYSWRPTMAIEGQIYDTSDSYPRINYTSVTVGSLDKIGVKLVEGRYFDSSDIGYNKSTAIVTESFSKRYFNGESAIGKRLRVVQNDGDGVNWITISGVVKNTIQGEPFSEVANSPTVFRPFSQQSREGLFVAMELNSHPQTLVQSLRKVLNKIDPNVAAFSMKSYRERIDQNTASVGFVSKIFLLLALIALLLALSGIYGVMSNSIIRKTQEIGVRRALGIPDEKIIMGFLKSSISQMSFGLIPGAILGGTIASMLGALLGTGQVVLVSMIIFVMLLISVIVVVATLIPIKKMLKSQPVVSLRYE